MFLYLTLIESSSIKVYNDFSFFYIIHIDEFINAVIYSQDSFSLIITVEISVW